MCIYIYIYICVYIYIYVYSTNSSNYNNNNNDNTNIIVARVVTSMKGFSQSIVGEVLIQSIYDMYGQLSN